MTDDQVADIELPGDQPDQDIFSSEPQVPMELVHAPVVEPHGFAGGHMPLPESVWVNGKELTIESRVRDLQDACNYLGLNASGAKKKLYDRLAKYVEVQYQKDIGVISKNIEQQMLGPQPKTQGKASEMPSNPLEVEQHEVTHLPFASWCDVCVRTKSRDDPTVHNADLERELTGIPHIQLDWMFLGRQCPSLVMIDSDTRYGAVCPTRSKGVWRSVAEFVVKFSLELNCTNEVCFVMDSEPATVGPLDMIVAVRQEMGFKASKQATRQTIPQGKDSKS